MPTKNPQPKTTHTNFSKFLVTIVIFLSIAVIVLGWLVFQNFVQESKDNPIIISQTEEAIINNEDPITPELSTQEIAQIQADRITEEADDNNPETIEQKTYTNPFFPTLKLNYPSDWEFETKTRKSFVEGLLERDIILSKNNTTLKITTEPAPIFGCGGGGDIVDPSFTTSYGLEEHTSFNNQIYYTFFPICGYKDLVESTININDISPTAVVTTNENVNFIYTWTTNIDSDDKDTNQELKEIRQILENSQFN